MGSSRGHTLMEVGPDGVAVITIVNPPVNSLSFDVLRSLKESFDQAIQRDDVKAIVVTGAKGKFSGGFDISAFGGIQEAKERPKPGWISVEIITDTIEAARKPSVAAIDGLALGGGLEVAMACNARLSTPTAQLGLPELQLGIIPGFGGTQRLPRLVGLTKGLEMILASKPVKGKEAFSLGLVDGLVSPNDLVNTARQWALDMLGHRRPWIASLYKTEKLEPLGEAREILKFARAQARKRAPNLQHPLVCIDVIEAGIVAGPRAGLWKEAEAFEGLVRSDTCKSLVHVFFAQRGTSKVPGVTDCGLAPRQVKKVAIIGGGLMGSGIATALILSNYPVILKEVNEKFLDAGINRIKANLQSRVKKGKLTKENFEKTISLLKGSLDYESFRDVDLVIEAVIENISLKQQIFSDLEKYCPPHCILASNTSTIDLNLIGEKTKSQDRIVGAHFFSPAHVMPLLEIVRTKQTSPQVIVDVLDISKKIKKTPVVVGNCTGFAVNRMFFPYTQAGLLLVERGADVYQIDRIITKFGMPMGPFRLADLVGFGVAIATGTQFIQNFPERTYKSMLIPLLQEDNRAGETTRKGFYLYDDKRKASPDPELKNYIEKARSISGVSVDPKLAKLQEKDIIEMIFFPVVNEACRVLDEGIAVKAADLDISAIMGMGFPPYRGGIIFWADSLGSKYIYSRLEKWSELYGEFFKPCAYLAARAAKGIPLSASLEQQAKSRIFVCFFRIAIVVMRRFKENFDQALQGDDVMAIVVTGTLRLPRLVGLTKALEMMLNISKFLVQFSTLSGIIFFLLQKVFKRLVDLVGFGETTRKGFYLYDDKRKASPDPELKNYIQKARSFTGFSVDPKRASGAGKFTL
ncbi:Glyoxysomal fatty acid beta-oxidation multifunctional protein MFP-a [Glycine max]|nr:Glyoxysomal fatty acid beta-oxidation multifunctional protein MFP-a [Glycine max]